MNLVLAENRSTRLASFTLFYIAQGLPVGLLLVALPAWLAEAGQAPAAVASFVAISSLPWAFKLFAGPIMDRFSYLPMGRRRPWVIAAQGGLLLSMIGMGLTPDPTQQIAYLTAAGFIVNLFAAVQDVAVDGMAIDVLPLDERGRANAFMAFGQISGLSGSGAVSGLTLVHFGLPGACWLLALGIALILALAILVRERSGEKRLPWTDGAATARSIELQADRWRDIFRDTFKVIALPASLVLMSVAFLWRVTDGVWLALAPIVTVQELGFDTIDFTTWNSLIGFIVATLGLLLGPLIDRHGAKYFFLLSLAGLFLCYFASWLFVDQWTASAYVPLSILGFQSAMVQIAFIAFIALHMNICWERVAATQFAIYMAAANFARSVGAGVYADLSARLNSADIVLLMSACCALAGLLLLTVNSSRHLERLRALDKA
ncbi:MAG: MFS transporter [Pseudomonadota bacterium]